MKFFTSARSDVKLRQNPPKSARQNWSNPLVIRQKLGLFQAIFIPRGRFFLWCFSADLALSQELPKQNIFLCKNILQKTSFKQLVFFGFFYVKKKF
jgi:hypothetical protein